MARKLTDGDRDILAEMDRDASEAWPPADDDLAAWAAEAEGLDADRAGADWPDEIITLGPAAGPTPLDAAWKAGFDTGQAEAEAETAVRALELEVARLQAVLSAARAALWAGDREINHHNPGR